MLEQELEQIAAKAFASEVYPQMNFRHLSSAFIQREKSFGSPRSKADQGKLFPSLAVFHADPFTRMLYSGIANQMILIEKIQNSAKCC
ncbi:hypothetical protein [Rhizobium sp. CF142]|uniref:hypothetical protein n=1 Tax=Rhizobium sp. CF142 TaxID=1144314 RepID=UPI00030971FD|nr:hypothetical protein [Rhizobium sp. CF142]